MDGATVPLLAGVALLGAAVWTMMDSSMDIQ
jgi:hypothetical protein